LNGEILTESNTKHIAEVLRKNERLRFLDVYLKNPDDKTMELLCDELKHPKCTLGLDVDNLTESYSRHLAELLRKNQRITALDLSFKNPDDRTMELLCDGLKHPECIIIYLNFDRDILTESCSRHLAEILKKNQRLRKLDLSFRNPDGKAMELLCDGLKHSECTIDSLRLNGDILTESCSRHLAEVLRKNQRLRELDLSLRNPDDKTMELLCDGLKHPECTIDSLRLNGDILTESCSRHLAEVFRKSQRLRMLY
ncbi:NACHT, LRR and PYD domains-containing protein 14, partial [Ophiophagus hannah]